MLGFQALLNTLLPHAGELAAAKASGDAGKRSSPDSNGTQHPALTLGECAALRQPPEAADMAWQLEQREQQHAKTLEAVAAAHADAAAAVQALLVQQHAKTEQAVTAAHADAAGAVQALMAPLRELAEQLPALLAVAPRLAELPAHLDAVPWKSAEVCNAAQQPTVASGKRAPAEQQAHIVELLMQGGLCIYTAALLMIALHLDKLLAQAAAECTSPMPCISTCRAGGCADNGRQTGPAPQRAGGQPGGHPGAHDQRPNCRRKAS